ncbi:exosortase-dependent surface protein XDP1 [Agarivorans gilvus]|uniref:Ice-binding protein C-terminal domain-containing protein n=1 Tax=Agarivorans gilvus TaxID=680279 RepID=A0ABQ1I3M1_9ALTE|nr:exosortase-dependent surface protein XDP1 [Agarivorans gilvus]GGB09073.1 hypothetical protein GCM10007414_23090 [Agarivorans gilvus]
MLKKILLAASCAVSLSAFGATETWSFEDFSRDFYDYGNSFSGTSGSGIGLNLTGWSNTGSGESIEDAYLDYADGNGLTLMNRDEWPIYPDHGIDNSNYLPGYNDYDMVLLSFDTAVNLAGFSLGWAYEYRNGRDRAGRHADVSVLAYNGADAPVLAGSTWNDVADLASGWTSEAQVYDADDYAYQAISSSTESKYWLIGAYNPVFGGSGQYAGNDAFKLAGVQAEPGAQPVNSVPEPGTVLLFAAGLFGIALRTRKR